MEIKFLQEGLVGVEDDKLVLGIEFADVEDSGVFEEDSILVSSFEENLAICVVCGLLSAFQTLLTQRDQRLGADLLVFEEQTVAEVNELPVLLHLEVLR